MSDKGDAYKYLDNKCTELGYESLGDFIGCQTTDTIATCMVAWFAEKQANGAINENSGLNIPVVVVPKGTLCKCGKQYEVYNKLEGTIVCTLCGKDRLA